MLTLEMYPHPNPNVIGRLVDDEAVVVLPEKGKVEVLNSVGARIWHLADGSRSIKEIAALICAEFEVEPPEAEKDTLTFIADLVGRGVYTLFPNPI